MANLRSALPTTAHRVEQNSADWVNERNRRQVEANIAFYASRLDLLERRLDELGREWDIERALEANAAAASLVGVAAAARDRRWLLLPLVVAAFLLQHAVQGWCPPVPALRRLGFRTAAEIESERVGLRRARGDFR